MRGRVAWCAAGLLAGLGPTAARSGDGAGTSGFPFLTLGSSPRIEALGEAGTALSEGVDALAWNPARLAVRGRGELAASYFNWLDGAQSGYAGAVWSLARGAVAIGARSFTVDDFGNVPGESAVGQSDLALSAGGAYPLTGSLRGGLSLQLVRSSLADLDATGWAADLGLSYRWVEGWDVAVAGRNIGPAFGYVEGVEEALPRQAALALGSTFGELRVGSEVLWEEGPGLAGRFGAELRVLRRAWLRLGARLGEEGNGAREPWAAGVGVAAREDVDLEYAFRDGTFQASHRLGIRWVPGRSLGATGKDLARSPREVYVDVLNEAIERSLVTFPTDVREGILVRSRTQHDATDLISETLVQRLADRGVTAELGAPPAAVLGSETAAEEGEEPRGPVLEYEVLVSEYEIVRARRERWVGPRIIDRKARVDLALSLAQPGEPEPAWTATASAEDAEIVAASRVPTSSGYPQAPGSGDRRELHPLVEPAIVGGLVTGLAVIFFANRNVGE